MKYDYHHVSPEHADIHARLVNWALWVRPFVGHLINPLSRFFRSNNRQWETPEFMPKIDELDAMLIEQMVRKLPPDQCEAIRWCYVRRTTPARQIRAIGCTYEGLYHLIQAGRGNLAVRLSSTRESTDRKMLVTA